MTPGYERPEDLEGYTRAIDVGCGKLYVTINVKNDDRYNEPPINEVWIEPSFKCKDDDDIQTYCCKSFLIPLARLITFNVRRLEKEDRGSFIKQIHNHECPKKNIVTAKSCVDAVARVLLCHWEGHKYKMGRCWVCGFKEVK